MAEVRRGSSLCVHWSLPLFHSGSGRKWRRSKYWAGTGTLSSHIIYLFTIFNILFHSCKAYQPFWKCTPLPPRSSQSLNNTEEKMHLLYGVLPVRSMWDIISSSNMLLRVSPLSRRPLLSCLILFAPSSKLILIICCLSVDHLSLRFVREMQQNFAQRWDLLLAH